MVATSYPLPRSRRITDILAGNGGVEYGPFGDGWGIFDTEDLAVYVKRLDQGQFFRIDQSGYEITKTDPNEAYDSFSIEFSGPIYAGDQFYLAGERTPERSIAISRGGTIAAQFLEKELSKIAVVEQELRRDAGISTDALHDLTEQVDGLLAGVSSIPVMASVTAFRALTASFLGTVVWLLSYTGGNRSGGGMWAYDAADLTSLDDGLMVVVDAAGRRWKPVSYGRAPRPWEILDLEYFLARTSDHWTALRNAHLALFNDTARVPSKLECHGIQLLIDRPLILRNADLGTFNNTTKANKHICNMSLKASDGSYGWQFRDYIYSIGGDTSGALRSLTLEKPTIDMALKDLVGLHFCGYYHISIDHPEIFRIGPSGAGIYSSKYQPITGIGKPAGSPVAYQNHGMQITTPDLRGSAGLAGGDQIGIYTEDGDFDVTDGWLSWFDKGIVTKIGGLNTQGIHFSMDDRVNSTIAVQCDAPRACSFLNDEMDGCVYLFQNPTDNMYSEGVSLTTFAQIACIGMKRSGNSLDGGATTGFGTVTIKTETPATLVNGLVVDPFWSLRTAGNIEAIKFLTTGLGAWNAAGWNNVIFRCPDNANGNEGVFPAGSKIRLVRTTAGGLRQNQTNGQLEFWNAANEANAPYLRPAVQAMYFGHLTAGAQTDRWYLVGPGHLKPVDDAVYDIGSITERVRDLYLTGAINVGAGKTATAAAGAATLNEASGVITTEALTTIAGGEYSLALSCNKAAAGDFVLWSLAYGTMNSGTPIPARVVVTASLITFNVRNVGGTFNGTLKIHYELRKAS